MSEEHSNREGWARPLSGVKRHYIVGDYSLCGFWVNVPQPYSLEGDDQPENCVACRGKLERHRIIQEMEFFAHSAEWRQRGLMEPYDAAMMLLSCIRFPKDGPFV
jgi:hypothetical protein